jgi:DNA-binding GntR family transcriptional regulator
VGDRLAVSGLLRRQPQRWNDGRKAADLLRELIARGDLRAGDRVVPAAVADAIGLSRVPVREGIIALECEGFVVVEPWGATRVTGLSSDMVRDHYAVTGPILGLATRWAVERARATTMAALDQALGTSKVKAGPGATFEAFEAARTALLDASGSSRARALLRVLPDLLVASGLDPDHGVRSLTTRALQTVRREALRGDADAAGAAMERFQARLGVAVAALLEARGALSRPAELLPWLARTATAGSPLEEAPAWTAPVDGAPGRVAASLRPASFASARTVGGARVEALLRDRIIQRKIPPGSRIDQREIARLAQVSTTPLREAMIVLERQGWITIEPHRGAFVAPFSARDVYDHYELYAVLFAFATRRLVEGADPVVLAKLRRELEAAQGAPDAAVFEAANRQLVDLLVHEAGSRPLVVALRATPEVMSGNFFERVPGSLDAHRAGYRRLVEEMERGYSDTIRTVWSEILRADAAGVIVASELD